MVEGLCQAEFLETAYKHIPELPLWNQTAKNVYNNEPKYSNNFHRKFRLKLRVKTFKNRKIKKTPGYFYIVVLLTINCFKLATNYLKYKIVPKLLTAPRDNPGCFLMILYM